MQETLSRETLSRETLSRETLSREAPYREAPYREASSRAALSRGRQPAGTLASVSVLLGAVGLFVFNLIFGPLAIGLAVAALRRSGPPSTPHRSGPPSTPHRSGPPSTPHRVVAWAGLVLGAADLLVLAALLAISLTHGSVTWHFGA
jgi:hypothetical protein